MKFRYSFASRRSQVMSRRGMVATSQPLAAQAGVSMLLRSGNAVDAAIAGAAALNVVEPTMTGIGGDAFALLYLSETREIKALNASGRAPYAATPEQYRQLGYQQIPATGIHAVTVPGALDGWCELLERYGTMSLAQVLEPAIELAQNGFPVTEVIGYQWRKNCVKLNASGAQNYLVNGKPPKVGEIFYQPDLANTFRKIASGGRDVFYRGEIAETIVAYSEDNGGLFTMQDFSDHRSTWVTPVSTNYRGCYDIYECPPNGQGLVALMALNLLEGYDLASFRHNSADYLHLLIEAIKLAFADARKRIYDPEFGQIPVQGLLSKSYAQSRRKLIDIKAAAQTVQAGFPAGNDTVYLAAMDKDGNSISFINSLFAAFGSGVVVGGTGICLHNRASGFNPDKNHPNCVGPHKRPYHTIIPAMVFKNGELFLTFGVMGGMMQPQGHVQVLLNLLDFGMDVQASLDSPRFRYIEGNQCAFEPGIPVEVVQELIKKGHMAVTENFHFSDFGGGQAIMVHPRSKAFIAGSDPRKDGCAIGI